MDNLDTSWIEEEEKLFSIQNKCFREPLKDIAMFFIYVNHTDEIEKISKEMEVLENETNSISKERILQIIQQKRHIDSAKKYRLFDLLSFQIDLDSENLQSFVDLDNDEELKNVFLKSVPIFDEIKCAPSIFIFHDINSLYFIFKEIPNPANIKSILKSGSSSIDHRVTKKVRISTGNEVVMQPEIPIENKRKSIRRFMKKMRNTRKMT